MAADRVEAARALAELAHRGQVDKAGRAYIEHPAAVAALVAERWPRDEDAVVAAWLHDVVEDTDVTVTDVRERFGVEVAAAVDALTRRTEEDPDVYYARVSADPTAMRVKDADLTHNSDPARLAVLPAQTRERLVAKYAHAREVLGLAERG